MKRKTILIIIFIILIVGFLAFPVKFETGCCCGPDEVCCAGLCYEITRPMIIYLLVHFASF